MSENETKRDAVQNWNARVAKAAPALLAALEAICEREGLFDYEEEPEDSPAAIERNITLRLHHNAHAAIRKARGES